MEAGLISCTLAKLYSERLRDKKKKNVDSAIACFEKADEELKAGALPGRHDASEVHLRIYEGLETLYQQRATGKKEDNMAKAER